MARRGPSIFQIVLFLAVVAGIIWLWSQRTQDPEDPVDTGLNLFFEEGRVEDVLFERGRGMRLVVREDDGFWIHEPYRDRADDRFLAQSLRVAATLKPERILPDTSGALFGLEPFAAKWSCRWPGGFYEIVLGDTLPAGAGRFARTSRSPNVLVVNAFLARRFLSPPFREIHYPAAAPLDVGQVDSVRIVTREEELLVVRHPGGKWEILSPVRAEASTEQMDRAVKTLRTESMTEYLGPVDEIDLKPIGLDPPRAVWTLIQGDRRETVEIGHPTSDQQSVRVIPSGRDVVAMIGAEQFRIWVDGTKRIREAKLMNVRADLITALEVRGSGIERRFVRRFRGDWVEEGQQDTLLVRSDAFEIALNNLCASHAVGFAPQGAAESFRADIRVYLTDRGGTRDTVELAMPQEDRAAIRTRRQPGICFVPAEGFRTWELWLHNPLRPIETP